MDVSQGRPTKKNGQGEEYQLSKDFVNICNAFCESREPKSFHNNTSSNDIQSRDKGLEEALHRQRYMKLVEEAAQSLKRRKLLETIGSSFV